MIWFLSLFTREYEQRHALLIIFLASSFWGVLWVPMRHIEAMGLSGLWVVVVFLPSVLLIFRIMQYVSPGLVGILMLSEALVAAVSAAFWLGETLSSTQWIGVGAILTTGVFIGFYEGKAVRPAKPA